ncbi:membrane-associated protein, putative, partial [Bodo saltans]
MTSLAGRSVGVIALLGCLILFAVCFSSTTKNRGALLASANSSATTAAEEADSPSPLLLSSVEQPTHAVDADNLPLALPSGTSSVSDGTDRQEYPYRFAEGVNGTYSFKKITGPAQPAPVAPGPSQAAMFVPLLTVKRPPSPSEDPGYAAHAASRPVIGGVYRSPYHEATCDVNLDPCETMRDTSLLHIADDDANRPPINFL